MQAQFKENFGILSNEDYQQLKNMHVLIVGAGGLGGYVANGLIRLGIEGIGIVDDDAFEIANLNRQLFSTHESIGIHKVDVLENALLKINPHANISTFKNKIQNVEFKELSHYDIIIDAVDDIPTKCYLEKIATQLRKPLIHGAIAGWYGQVGIILPHAKLLHEIYGEATKGIEKDLRSPTFTPAIIANIMVSETVKYVIAPEKSLTNRIMMIDVLNHEYQLLIERRKDET